MTVVGVDNERGVNLSISSPRLADRLVPRSTTALVDNIGLSLNEINH